MQSKTEVWLTIADIAEILKVSRSNIYHLVASGRLTAHRIGLRRGSIRVALADLEQFLATVRHEPQLPPGLSIPTPNGHAKDPAVFKHLDVTRALGSKKRPKPR
jgi:excisionase family DNA binding protein